MNLWKVKATDDNFKDTFYVEAEQAADAIQLVLDQTRYRCQDIISVRWFSPPVIR